MMLREMELDIETRMQSHDLSDEAKMMIWKVWERAKEKDAMEMRAAGEAKVEDPEKGQGDG